MIEGGGVHYRRSPRPRGGIGRRAGFKILCPYGRIGSTPIGATSRGGGVVDSLVGEGRFRGATGVRVGPGFIWAIAGIADVSMIA